MDTKKHTKELQASYHAMVDAVEEFVVKEGKTLQQAFHDAEEKLDDAKDMSKDKIKRASKELKDNLRVWGEAVEGASEAYKDQIKFDVDYVNHSIWDKFHSIAQSNTTEFLAFTNTLREKAKKTLNDDHDEAHHEHNRWQADHALWLSEVELWKQEHLEALSKLTRIEKALKQQSKSLTTHAKAIEAHAKIDAEHEKTMKNAEQDPTSKAFKVDDEEKNSVHHKERKIHAQQSELHHALKTHHFKITAMINMLHKETHKAPEAI